MPTITIISGVNGSGKSTLYKILGDIGVKVNADDIGKELGDIRDRKVQFEAGKKAVTLINNCLENEVDFNYETTLSGNNVMRIIDRAYKQGYKINIYYIAVTKSVSKARIENRVLQGGHDIPQEDIERRYMKSVNNLNKILGIDYVDRLEFIENQSTRYKTLLVKEKDKVTYRNKIIPKWIGELFNI